VATGLPDALPNTNEPRCVRVRANAWRYRPAPRPNPHHHQIISLPPPFFSRNKYEQIRIVTIKETVNVHRSFFRGEPHRKNLPAREKRPRSLRSPHFPVARTCCCGVLRPFSCCFLTRVRVTAVAGRSRHVRSGREVQGWGSLCGWLGDDPVPGRDASLGRPAVFFLLLYPVLERACLSRPVRRLGED